MYSTSKSPTNYSFRLKMFMLKTHLHNTKFMKMFKFYVDQKCNIILKSIT